MDFRREQLIKRAYDRSFFLTVRNPLYVEGIKAIIGSLLNQDVGQGDVTSEALLADKKIKAIIHAKEHGVLAGGDEFSWLYAENGVEVKRRKKDGETFAAKDILFEVEGPEKAILKLERTGLNILQRMSGIATETRRIADKIRKEGFKTAVTATRKTPWGYLDKRAVTVGSGFSHRLGLHESVMIKDNHLASLKSQGMKNPVDFAIDKAWEKRKRSVFLEIEVKNQKEALAAARKFRKLQEQWRDSKPCIIMLDNMAPADVKKIAVSMKRAKLYDFILLEASGNVSEDNILDFARAGADACSLGKITHSVKAIDISQKIL